jgi:hypothetical protein
VTEPTGEQRPTWFQIAICTLAMSAFTGGTSLFIGMAHGDLPLDLPRMLGAGGSLAAGWWLFNLGDGRSLIRRVGP